MSRSDRFQKGKPLGRRAKHTPSQFSVGSRYLIRKQPSEKCVDIHASELRTLNEIGLDFGIKFQGHVRRSATRAPAATATQSFSTTHSAWSTPGT